MRRAHLGADGIRLDRAERVRRLACMTIKHPKSEAVYNAIDFFLERAASQRSGVNYLVAGPTRVGKSTLSYSIYKSLLQKEADRLGKPLKGKYIELTDRDIRPAIWVEAKSDTTTTSLLEKLLEELGDPSPARGKIPEKERRLAKHLAVQRVQNVIIDEVQHFAQHRTSQFKYKLGDWLKSNLQNFSFNSYDDPDVLSGSFCNIIFFGTEEAIELFHTNEQLKGRNIGGHNYLPYNWQNQADREDYLDILGTIDAVIPFAQPSNLTEFHRARKLNEASNGSVGLTMKLISSAGAMAIRDESDRILDIHLRDSFDELEAVIDLKENPWRILDQSDDSRQMANIQPNRKTRLKGKGPSTAPSFNKK